MELQPDNARIQMRSLSLFITMLDQCDQQMAVGAGLRDPDIVVAPVAAGSVLALNHLLVGSGDVNAPSLRVLDDANPGY